jgi:hypothetical protein
MHSIGLPLTLVLLSACTAWSSALASEDYDNCTGFIDSLPAIVATQGTWCLRKDLSTSMASGSAIHVAANNVTLDCNHFKIGGLAAGSGTSAIGINIDGQANLTVRHCNIRGFAFGIATTSGGRHLIEHNSFDSNTLQSMRIRSVDSTIRRNRVIDTGGSSAFSNDAEAIHAENSVDIIDNTISGVAPGYPAASAYGIRVVPVSSLDAGTIAGNRVRGLAPTGDGVAYGIHIFSQMRSAVRGNDLQGSGAPGSIGVYCGSNRGTARENSISGFETGVLNCSSTGNIVNPN